MKHLNDKFFNVDYDALRKFRKETESNIAQCTTELETLHTAVNKLVELKNFKGLTAKHMKAYYNDVYGLIIEAINDIFEMYSSVFCLYQNRLMRQVDSDEHARLSREAMYYLEQDISNTTKRLDEEVDEVNSILRGIADIHTSTRLDFDKFLSEKKKVISYIDRKIDKVYEVDNHISSNEISILMNAIKATQSVIETYADATRRIEQYQPSSYGNESSVLNLGEAFYEIQKYYEKNGEEIFAATKQQWKIDEELGVTEEKEEQAEKKQNSFFSTVLGFVPVLGDAKDVQETVTGVDVVTGEKLGAKERIFTGICIVVPVVNGKAVRVVGDAAKSVKVGKAVSKATASVPIVIKITKEESGIMKLVVKKADDSGSKIAKAIKKSKAKKIGDDGTEILGKKVTKEAVESGLKTVDTGDLKVIETKTPELANKEWLAKGYDKPPYHPDFEVKVVEAGNEEYVRVFSYNEDGTSNKLGGWLMKKSDIEGLTPAQIADKYALPKEPTHICDVNLSPDFNLQTGIANSVEGWGKGGGQQFDTMGKFIDEDAFVNERLIGE